MKLINGNEPFKHWLDRQIGGNAWQRRHDSWKKHRPVVRSDLIETEAERL